jgi:hypothetical protein
MNTDLGRIIFDASSPAAGPVAPILGGLDFDRNSTFMNVDHNIKVKADNTTTQHQLSNVCSAVKSNRILSKDTYLVHENNRSTINPTNVLQTNLRCNPLYSPINYQDGIRTTTKETVLHSYSGGAMSSNVAPMLNTHYTTKDNTGGSTNIATNRQTVNNHYNAAGQVTGNRQVANSGEVNIKKMDNDDRATKGTGSYNRAAPDSTRTGNRFYKQQGEINFNPNRSKVEDCNRTSNYLIDGLLNNGYSVYNNGKNINYPEFNASSSSPIDSGFKLKPIKEVNFEKVKNSKTIPVHNSSINPNELIVRNSPDGLTENPMLFNDRNFY